MKTLKKELRKNILTRRDQLGNREIESKSTAIMDKLLGTDLFAQANTVMFFLSFGSEVSTFPMIEKSLEIGKQVVVPKTVREKRQMIPSLLLDIENDLTPGMKGILEPKDNCLRPVAPDIISMVVVPGVAFDLNGNRLGYGGGYYDRFFNLLNADTPLVAMAFSCQVLEEIPTGPFDKKVDLLLTEERTYVFNPTKLKRAR